MPDGEIEHSYCEDVVNAVVDALPYYIAATECRRVAIDVLDAAVAAGFTTAA